MYGVKGAPFRYKGAINVEDCKTSLDVMEKSGLDWEVAKCELIAKMPGLITDKDRNDEGFLHGGDYYKTCPNAFATYRTDYNIPLGVVKERYTIVQNTEAFSFFDNAIGKNKAIWQTAGFFGNGERIFVSAKLPEYILVNGDPVENYLVFTTSHDGSSGVKILFTPIRIICQNTLNAAIRQSSNYVSFRHTSSVHKNIDIATEILGICKDRTKYLTEMYNQMAKIRMKDEEVYKLFGDVILSDNELTQLHYTGHNITQLVNKNWRAIEDSGISMKKANVLNEMANYYVTGPGQKEIAGTAWGAYGAITGYYSNVDNSIGIKRMDSLLFGDKARKIETAGNLLLAA